tara:strand:- start:199 stop:492 length:294 start_codon:yes stop_codon:yes gene_type:complete
MCAYFVFLGMENNIFDFIHAHHLIARSEAKETDEGNNFIYEITFEDKTPFFSYETGFLYPKTFEQWLKETIQYIQENYDYIEHHRAFRLKTTEIDSK